MSHNVLFRFESITIWFCVKQQQQQQRALPCAVRLFRFLVSIYWSGEGPNRLQVLYSENESWFNAHKYSILTWSLVSHRWTKIWLFFNAFSGWNFFFFGKTFKTWPFEDGTKKKHCGIKAFPAKDHQCGKYKAKNAKLNARFVGYAHCIWKVNCSECKLN